MIRISDLLLESPDEVLGVGYGGKLKHYDPDAIVFGYIQKVMHVGCNINVDGNRVKGWHNVLPLFYGRLRPIERSKIKFAGRLWYSEKVISFWGLYPTRNQLQIIIRDILNEMQSIVDGKSDNKMSSPYLMEEAIMNMDDFDINSSEWRIEIPRAEKMTVVSKTTLISLRDYKSTDTRFTNIDHIKSPMIKKSDVADGMGSRTKKYGNLSRTQYHQIVSTSESVKK